MRLARRFKATNSLFGRLLMLVGASLAAAQLISVIMIFAMTPQIKDL